MIDKNYFELSESEVASRATLTPKEQAAVDSLLKAVKALPKSICISVEDMLPDGSSEPNFTVSKRITRGSAQEVASLRKKSLSF